MLDILINILGILILNYVGFIYIRVYNWNVNFWNNIAFRLRKEY